MRYGVAGLVFLLASPLLAQEPQLPARSTAADLIDFESELRSLGTIDGTWIGDVKLIHDPVGAYRDYSEGFRVLIDIDGENVSLSFVEEGDVRKPFPSEAVLVFSDDGTALIDYLGGSATVTEIWSISLNQVGPNEVRGFISRTVHNLALRRDSPWRVFPVYSSVEFKRIS